jgi:hypothetical protein
MNKVGILATLQARTGKEADVEQFLSSATPLVAAEVGTTAWFAFKIGPATFGIFDTFKDDEGRNAHVTGEVAKALFARAEECRRAIRLSATDSDGRHPRGKALNQDLKSLARVASLGNKRRLCRVRHEESRTVEAA